MAGGPIAPISMTPDASGEVTKRTHVGGTNGRRIQGLGVTTATLLTADRTWWLVFPMPPELPAGTAKLWLRGIANVSSGNAVFNPSWASVALENFDTITLNAEGNTTITFTAADAFHDAKITLDADTIVAGEMVVMALVAVDASWTITAASTWLASIIWE